jgi:DNA polymerase III delta prime subunit
MKNHHAQLLVGYSLEEADIPQAYRSPSYDVTHLIVTSLTIADARELTAQSFRRPLSGKQRVFVIVTNEITLEAQNALLKLFEEPPQHVQFYLVIPPTTFLLPTLRSRLFVMDTDAHSTMHTPSFDTFLQLPYAERLARIAEVTKEKDTEEIAQLLTGCEYWVQEDIEKRAAVLETLLFIRAHINAKGSSAKMLLEELALSLPLNR